MLSLQRIPIRGDPSWRPRCAYGGGPTISRYQRLENRTISALEGLVDGGSRRTRFGIRIDPRQGGPPRFDRRPPRRPDHPPIRHTQWAARFSPNGRITSSCAALTACRPRHQGHLAGQTFNHVRSQALEVRRRGTRPTPTLGLGSDFQLPAAVAVVE